jgi:tetratricopeptide (TPR) repeat protein/ferredoxin
MRSRSLPTPSAVEAKDCGKSTKSAPALRPSKNGRWRALALVAVHVLVAAHVAHWLRTGSTLSPLEPSEAMEFAKHDLVNAGFVFFGLAILSTLVLGRWFCGWACHVVALQDLCLVLLKRAGVRPKPLRSRWLAFVPSLAALYMFVYPLVYRVGSGAALGPYGVRLTREDFWATFPPWPVALLTFAVCGFAIVYFLGAKGFCTYACPYGAIFGFVDRFAVGRIRVTDACEGCGHCTATCTSNVIVHEEVREHGMVVDPGCMKCLDCVSVCPKGALYFGFGRPSLASSARAAKKAKANAGWAEEAVLAASFAGAFFTFRGLYGLVPFLLALGLAAVLGACTNEFVQMLRRPSARFLGRALKLDGRLTPGGRVFGAAMLAVLTFAAHSAWIQFHGARSAAAFEELRDSREAFLVDPSRTLAPETRARAEGAARSARLVEHYGLLTRPEDRQRRAWLALFAGAPAEFEAELEAALAAGDEPATVAYDLARFREARGRTDEAVAGYEASLAARPSASAFDRLARLHFAAGRSKETLSVFRRALEAFPTNADLVFNEAVVLGLLDRRDEAIAAFRAVLDLDPGRVDALENLAGLLEQAGRIEEARVIRTQIEGGTRERIIKER